MPLRYLTLKKPQYVPQYNTLDPNLVNSVAGAFQQQGAQSRQHASNTMGILEENIMSTAPNLPEEFQQDMMNIMEQSRGAIEQSFKERGARHSLSEVDRQARNAQKALQPYQSVAAQFQAYQERLKKASEENNLDSGVRNYLEQTAGFERDEDRNPVFRGRDLSIIDNWRDLHDVARETIKDVEANISETGVHLPEEDQRFYQRVRYKYRDFDRLQLVGMNRLLSDRDAVRQMELSLESNGVVFEDGKAYRRTGEGDIEPIIVEEDGASYQKTKSEMLEEEAARYVNPTAAARSLSQQTYSYTSKNSLHFSALENDATDDYIVIPYTTTAGKLEINNPVALDTEINQSIDNYQKTLDSLEQQGIIEKSLEEDKGYRVVPGMEGEYNSRRANLQGMREHISKQERRRERLQVLAFQNFHGDKVTEENVDDYMYKIREGSEEFNQYVRGLKQTMASGDEAEFAAKNLRKLPNRLTQREIVELATSGKTPKDLGFDRYLSEKEFKKAEDQFKGIKNRYEYLVNKELSKKSPEYKTYVDLLKEDAKGRTVEVPVIFPTNGDVLKVGDTLASRLIQASDLEGSSQYVKWLNTNKAHQSIYETGDVEDIEEMEFAGFSYHPDTGENLAVFAALDSDGKSMGTVYTSATDSFKNLIPVNNEFAKESYYNNMINVAGSSPSREGSVPLLLNDVEQALGREIDISVKVARPVKSSTSQGLPIVRGEQQEVRLTISRNGKKEDITFATTNEAMRFIKDLENSVRNRLIEQANEQ